MSKLVLEKFKCLEESDEVGSDSPYFMVYVAQARSGSAKSDVKFVRKEAWDNEVDTGDTFIANKTVSEGMHHDLVIVGMIEEDWDPDLASPVSLLLAQNMKSLDSLLAAVTTGVNDTVAEIVRSEFARQLKNFCVNDEILGVKRLKNTANPLVFTGDDSNYQVKFKFA
jgi:hypothetical protein